MCSLCRAMHVDRGKCYFTKLMDTCESLHQDQARTVDAVLVSRTQECGVKRLSTSAPLLKHMQDSTVLLAWTYLRPPVPCRDALSEASVTAQPFKLARRLVVSWNDPLIFGLAG
jgi:hypothetical protein